MPTNAQQFGSDYYTTTANNMSDMFSQVGEEWDAMRADEVAYNEFLQNQINIYDQTIRQYGVIGDTQKHRATQNQWELVRAQQSENNAVATSQRRMTSSVGTILPDIRTDGREAMSGEVGDSGQMIGVIATGASADDTVSYITERINTNPTMGRFLSTHFIAGVGEGEASLGVRAAAGLGIADSIRRMRKAQDLNIDDTQILQIAASTVGINPVMIQDDGFMVQEQTAMTREAMEAVSEAPNHSDQLSIMEGLASKWQLPPEMIATSGRMSEQETLRADAQTELDARLAEQQGQDRSAEIAATFRDRVGSMGSGAQYSDTVIGSLRRQRDLRRNGQRLERLQNATQSERILMGSVGQARQMALRGSNAQEAGGAAWQQATVLLGMARQNGIPNSDALVQLAADAAGGDVTVRDEILRNYLYLRQQGESAVALNTPEQQDRLLAERTDTPSTPDPVVAANQVAAFGAKVNVSEENGTTTVEHEDETVVVTTADGTTTVMGPANPNYADALVWARTDEAPTIAPTDGASTTDSIISQLNVLADEMGIPRPVVTSTGRDGAGQAAAMHNNWLANGGTNGGRAYLEGLYTRTADDGSLLASRVDDIFASGGNNAEVIREAGEYLETNPISRHQGSQAIDFDSPRVGELLREGKSRGIFTGDILEEQGHWHVQFDIPEEEDVLPEELPTNLPASQANAGAWNTLSPQQKEQSRASYNGVLSAAWGTPNQGAIAANILGRMPPGSRLYYPQGSDKPVVISEYDLRTQGLPAGGIPVGNVGATRSQSQADDQMGSSVGLGRGRGAATSVYPSGRPRNLMAESEAATERGIPVLAARAATRRRADQAELLRLQGLLDNPVDPNAFSPQAIADRDSIPQDLIYGPPTQEFGRPIVRETIRMVPNLNQSAYDLAVNQALLDATAMTSDTGDTSSP